MDEIDRILSSEAPSEPSPDLALRVMDEVRRSAEAPPPLAFPWRRVAASAAILCLVSASAMALPALRGPAAGAIGALDWHVAGMALATFGILIGTIFAAWRAD